jgi:hypothetical protein
MKPKKQSRKLTGLAVGLILLGLLALLGSLLSSDEAVRGWKPLTESADDSAGAAERVPAPLEVGGAAVPLPAAVNGAGRQSLFPTPLSDSGEPGECLQGVVRDALNGLPVPAAELRWRLPGPAAGEDQADSPHTPATGMDPVRPPDPALTSTASSAEDGRFSLPWPGPADLLCSHPDYVSVALADVDWQAELEIGLMRAAKLRIQVLGPDENSVDARVEVWRCDGANPLGEPLVSADKEGLEPIELGGLRPGNFLVRASPKESDDARPGRAQQALQSGIEVAPGGLAEVRLRLASERLLPIELQAVDSAGQPVQGVILAALGACRLEVQPLWDALPEALEQAAKFSALVPLFADPVEFGPFIPGRLKVTCSTPWAQRLEFETALPRRKPLSLSLPVGDAWSGTVVAGGRPLARALVALVEAPRARELGYAPARAAAQAQEALQRNASTELSGAAAVGGLLTPSLEPPAFLVTTSDAQGRFRFAWRPAGVELYCVVWPPDYQPDADPGALAPDGGRISPAGLLQRGSAWLPPQFELSRTSALTGSVRTADGASPAGARLELRPAEASRAEPELVAEADATGAFRFAAVPNAALLLEVSLEGYAPLSLPIPAVTDPGQSRPPALSLLLEPVFSVRGRVLDWEGQIMAGAKVVAEINRLILAHAETDRSGNFELQGLPRGLVEFSASAAEASATQGSRQTLRVPVAEPIVLRLRPEPVVALASVEGSVRKASNGPDGRDWGIVAGLFVEGLGPYAVLKQSDNDFLIEGVRAAPGQFTLGAPGFETVSLAIPRLAPRGYSKMPEVTLYPVVQVRFTDLQGLLHACGQPPFPDRNFLQLVPLHPDQGGPRPEREILDLGYAEPALDGSILVALPAAAFEVRLPSRSLAVALDLRSGADRVEFHLPQLLASSEQSED